LEVFVDKLDDVVDRLRGSVREEAIQLSVDSVAVRTGSVVACVAYQHEGKVTLTPFGAEFLGVTAPKPNPKRKPRRAFKVAPMVTYDSTDDGSGGATGSDI
jgi:hypothetical protein